MASSLHDPHIGFTFPDFRISHKLHGPIKTNYNPSCDVRKIPIP